MGARVAGLEIDGGEKTLSRERKTVLRKLDRAAQGQPPDFAGPFAKPQRMAGIATGAVVAALLTVADVAGAAGALTVALWIVALGTAVTALTQHEDDTWTVSTNKGDIDADIVVNAGGYRVNEIAAMMGVHHPVASMEHQYFVTDDIPAIAAAGHRMPLLRCPIS
ncbi:MAG: FAD-dependent oxidoreductase, partial [Pseudomonadota bacterium]